MPTPRAVAVPGLGLTARGWTAVTEALHSALPAVVVTLPAFGLPAPRGQALDPASLADLLAARIADQGLLADGPVVLMGHSASGQVVAEVARRHPHAVRALVLVGPTTDPRIAPRPRLVSRWLRTAAREDPRRVPEMLREYATTRLSGFARALRAARRRDLRATLAATDVPVLVARGPHDRLATAGWAAALAAVRPGVEVATTARGAHMLPLTRPGELAGLVEAFSQRVCRDLPAG
ncbi:hypothetical protein GCM10023200_40990 [Actinomycetospora chlora]|uniref:AB hydrolase-1 domain-containing protein n=1 Tax=Actinomycetospora chlora TaxID=663608 RepID=A0ABP9BTH3_9PSEU